MSRLRRAPRRLLSDFRAFTRWCGGVSLRPYQVEAAEAVLGSIASGAGETFVWKFARQGGKDETLAALYLYLMMLYSGSSASIVTAAPTFSPQIELAMRRLKDRLH